LADQKKAPPANVDELKARLGLIKKPEAAPQARPGAAGQARQAGPGAGIPGPGVPPGLKPPPGVSPPPFLQAQKKAADMHRDPFAKDIASDYTRQSLTEGPKTEDMAISIDDQKKVARKMRTVTIVICVVVGLIAMALGMVWGRGISSRLIYNKSVEDGKLLYDVLQYSSQRLSFIKTKLVSAQSKANQSRTVDFVLINELKAIVKAQGCEGKGDVNEKCVLRLADLANRSYQIYKPDIVQLLFTYSSQWNDFLIRLDDHVVRTLNDKPALEKTGAKVEALFKPEYGYGLVFTRKMDTNWNQEFLFGNIAVVAKYVTDDQGMVKTMELQGGPGYPTIEKQLYQTGDMGAEPETWVIPLGQESLQGVIAFQQISHFIDYQTRLQKLIELGNSMDQNQKALLISIGEIASLDKQFAF
jgi:hypothetical protein